MQIFKDLLLKFVLPSFVPNVPPCVNLHWLSVIKVCYPSFWKIWSVFLVCNFLTFVINLSITLSKWRRVLDVLVCARFSSTATNLINWNGWTVTLILGQAQFWKGAWSRNLKFLVTQSIWQFAFTWYFSSSKGILFMVASFRQGPYYKIPNIQYKWCTRLMEDGVAECQDGKSWWSMDHDW